ncbi:MAG: hypothetical protein EXS67_00460 [Candidatus Margulisbacteria bacterium]|nr:hypothetical protein [Candidatus Margulisiibacteriota bacterium]
MHYAYLIRAINFPDQTYTGYTADITQRLDDHRSGKSVHTQKYRPWEMRCIFYHRIYQGISEICF